MSQDEAAIGRRIFDSASNNQEVSELYNQLPASQQKAVLDTLHQLSKKMTIPGLVPTLEISGIDTNGDGLADKLSGLRNTRTGQELYHSRGVLDYSQTSGSKSLVKEESNDSVEHTGDYSSGKSVETAMSDLWQPIAKKFAWGDAREIWVQVKSFEEKARGHGASQRERVRFYENLTAFVTGAEMASELSSAQMKTEVLNRLNHNTLATPVQIQKNDAKSTEQYLLEPGASGAVMIGALENYFKEPKSDWASSLEQARVDYVKSRELEEFRYNHLPVAQDYQVQTDADGYLRSVTGPDGRTTYYSCNREGGLNSVTEPDGTKYTRKGDGKWYKNDSNQPVEQVVSLGPIKEPFLEVDDGHIYAVNENGRTRLSAKRVVAEPRVGIDNFAQMAQKVFALTNRDGNGCLSASELGYAVNNDNLSSEYQQVVAALYKEMEAIAGLKNGDGKDGVSLEDLKAFAEQDLSLPAAQRLRRAVEAQLLRVQALQEVGSSKELYHNNEIEPEHVKQGAIGDCYFMAALASLAATDPQVIARSIKENRDGTFTVTFAGAPNEPITVKPITDAELSLFADGGKSGIWAAVMEKAYGKGCNEGVFSRAPLTVSSGDTNQEGADGGGWPEYAMKLLTGKSVDSDVLLVTAEKETAFKLNAALNGEPKRAVTAVINGSVRQIFADNYSYTDDNFARKHAYSILAFKPGAGGGMVTVRNPWGGEDGSTGGTKEITMKEFYENFSKILYLEK